MQTNDKEEELAVGISHSPCRQGSSLHVTEAKWTRKVMISDIHVSERHFCVKGDNNMLPNMQC